MSFWCLTLKLFICNWFYYYPYLRTFMMKNFMAGNFLAGDFLAHGVNFGDLMAENFMAGDFLTWILSW